jgi:hypothetical protein
LFGNIRFRRCDGTKTNEKRIFELVSVALIFLPVSYIVFGLWMNFMLIFLVANSFLFYSPFFMLLRLETFGDKKLHTKKGGYDPIFFWEVSVSVGFFGFLLGLVISVLISMFFNDILGDYSIYFVIICGLIAQTIILLPDYYGKLLSIDFRTGRGKSSMKKFISWVYAVLIPILALVTKFGRQFFPM